MTQLVTMQYSNQAVGCSALMLIVAVLLPHSPSVVILIQYRESSEMSLEDQDKTDPDWNYWIFLGFMK